jgi:hypothetical protein
MDFIYKVRRCYADRSIGTSCLLPNETNCCRLAKAFNLSSMRISRMLLGHLITNQVRCVLENEFGMALETNPGLILSGIFVAALS